MRRATLAAAALGALALPSAAAAHVTVNPNTAAADSFARFDVRVPTERADASTTKVTMRLPKGLFFVSFQPKDGWKRTVTMEKLDPPEQVFGEEVTERVATVTWEGGEIAPGEFDEFGFSAKVPDAPGTTLVFPSVQTYSSGEVVRWIGSEDADTPASRVALGPKEGEGDGGSATTAAGGDDEGEDDDDDSSLALALGAAGLVTGLAALGVALFRRPRRT